MSRIGSYCCSFFQATKETIGPYLPSPAEAFSAACATATTVMLGPAVGDLGLLPKAIEPVGSYIFSALIAAQTDLTFKRPELVKNAQRFATWLSGKSPGEEEKSEPGCIKKIARYFATPIVASSLFTVPIAVFALAKFQIKQILTDKELMNLLFEKELSEKDDVVVALSIVCALIATYYSTGTEGASAYKWLSEWLSEKHPDFSNSIKNKYGKCGKKCFCTCCSSFAIPLAGLGALEHSMRETGSLLSSLVENSLLADRNWAFVIAAASMIIMALQNCTFQGREFVENFEELLEYVQQTLSKTTEMTTPNQYGTLEDDDLEKNKAQENIKLDGCKKAALYLINSVLVVAPSVAAHFSLAYLTLRQTKDPFRTILAVINTIEETATETVSACDKVHEMAMVVNRPALK